MKQNVTVHMIQNDDGSYIVTGAVAQRGWGSLKPRTFKDTKSLQDFLVDNLGIDREVAKEELDALHAAPRGKRTRSIPNVMLDDEEIQKYGLGPA